MPFVFPVELGRAVIADQIARFAPLSQPYALAFLFSTLLFVLSVFLPGPLRFGLWGLGLLMSLALPLVTLSLGRNNPQVQAQIDLSF